MNKNELDELNSYLEKSLEQLDLLRTKMIMIGMFNFTKVIQGHIMSIGGMKIIINQVYKLNDKEEE